MTGRLFRLYQRKRIINIHVNVVVAGLLAIALVKFPVHWISQWIGPEQKALISVIAYGLDTVIDVCVYFGLHWVANHWSPAPPKSDADERHQAAPKPHFLADVGKVQAERLALVPVFALVSMGSMWTLQEYQGMRASWAFVVGFVGAIIVTRILHTLIGLYTGTFVDLQKRTKTDAADDQPQDETRAS